MGLISLGGLGSGLEVSKIVDALVAAERAPKENSLNRLEGDVTVTLTGLGGLSDALDELRSSALDLSLSSNFGKRKVSISDNSFYTATATSGANSGNYDIEVVSLAKGSTSESQIFTGGGETTFGDGALTFTLDGQSFDVEVAATDTLQDIRNNINAATGNENVSANLLNNVSDGIDTGSVLTLSSSVTGQGNDLVISFTGDASLADLADNLTQSSAASDAQINLDGFSATSATNTFSNIIQDVTINIKKEHEAGESDSLGISVDSDSTKTLISEFVETYNAFVDLSKQLGSADTSAPGILLGDSTLRQINSQLRNLFSSSNSSIGTEFNSLTSIGVTTTRDGKLELNSATLDAAIDNNFENFDQLFAGENGFATKLRDLVNNYTGSGGIITSREESLNGQLDRIADDRLNLNLRIESLQLRLTRQFAVMDASVAQFNSTQSYIAQQFENLPGFGGKDN